MAVNTDLIRAGLPWSSPLKIIVQSAEVINDATINRGLLNLLNNDYYLDIKTQAINNFIEDYFITHITDKSIHFTLDSVLQLLGTDHFLKSDARVAIPVININKDNQQISLDIEKINQFINMVPKYLNGNILLLQFVYATTEDCYKTMSDNIQIIPPLTTINTSYLPVYFNGFSNGTILIRSNLDPKSAVICDDVNSIANINKLITYSGFSSNLSSAILALQNTNTVTDIISSAFTFKGNSVNKYYSAFSFSDCTADIYLNNCNIINNLEEFTQEAIDKAKEENRNRLPQASDVLALFLCNQCTSDRVIIAKQEYTNLQEFPNNVSLDIKSEISQISTLFPVINNNKVLELNKYQTTYIKPDHLQFTNTDETFLFETIIRKYMYNFNQKNKNFSICFWGNLSSINPNQKTSHAALFADSYITEDNQLRGLYIYLDQVYGNFYKNKDYNSTTYTGSYQSYLLTNDIQNQDCFYVIDFITTDVPDYIDRGCYIKDKRYRIIPEGKMRVNVTVYRGFDKKEIICIPNIGFGDQNFDQKCRYTFDKPKVEQDMNMNPIRFFANKVKNNTQDEEENLFNWNYFTGSVRNILLFNKLLTRSQINALVNKGYATVYYWKNIDDNVIIDSISISSYLGALHVNNSKHLNIVRNYIATQAK